MFMSCIAENRYDYYAIICICIQCCLFFIVHIVLINKIKSETDRRLDRNHEIHENHEITLLCPQQ